MSSTTPTEYELGAALHTLRADQPEWGRTKVLEKLRSEHNWQLSEKRLKAFMDKYNLISVPQVKIAPTEPEIEVRRGRLLHLGNDHEEDDRRLGTSHVQIENRPCDRWQVGWVRMEGIKNIPINSHPPERAESSSNPNAYYPPFNSGYVDAILEVYRRVTSAEAAYGTWRVPKLICREVVR